MCAQRLRSFRYGDTDERMAEAMLSLLAFTTSVRREDDVGHDLVCVLIQRDGNNLLAGSSFTVQIKSHTQRDTFVYENANETRWLETQQTPFFIGLTYRDEQRLDLFSTWNIHNSYLNCRSKSYHLIPGDLDTDVELPFPRKKPACREGQTIPLGRPILSLTFADLVNEEKLEKFRQILQEWILIERNNLVRREMKLHWIDGPFKYKTNQRLSTTFVTHRKTVYWKAVHYDSCLVNFTRSATSLRNTMNRRGRADSSDEASWRRRILALENVIRAFWSDLEGSAKTALEKELRRNIKSSDVAEPIPELLSDFFEEKWAQGKLSELWGEEDEAALLRVLGPYLGE